MVVGGRLVQAGAVPARKKSRPYDPSYVPVNSRPAAQAVLLRVAVATCRAEMCADGAGPARRRAACIDHSWTIAMYPP